MDTDKDNSQTSKALDTRNEIITTLLHDVIEDTPVKLEDLEREGFPRLFLPRYGFLPTTTEQNMWIMYAVSSKTRLR